MLPPMSRPSAAGSSGCRAAEWLKKTTMAPTATVVSRITVAVELANRPNAIPELWTWWIENGPAISTSSPTSSCRATTCFVSWSAAIAAPATSARASHWRGPGAKESLGSRDRLKRVRRRPDAHLGRAPWLGAPCWLAHPVAPRSAAASRRSASSQPDPGDLDELVAAARTRDDPDPGWSDAELLCEVRDQGSVGATTLGGRGDADLPGGSIPPDDAGPAGAGAMRSWRRVRRASQPQDSPVPARRRALARELLLRRLDARCGLRRPRGPPSDGGLLASERLLDHLERRAQDHLDAPCLMEEPLLVGDRVTDDAPRLGVGLGDDDVGLPARLLLEILRRRARPTRGWTAAVLRSLRGARAPSRAARARSASSARSRQTDSKLSAMSSIARRTPALR